MPRRLDLITIRLLNLGPTAAWRTQAVYHATAEMMTAESPDTIIIAQSLAPYLCLGYHQDYNAVLNRDECERRGLSVVKRRLDGDVQYIDANQLLIQLVFHHSRAPKKIEELFSLFLTAPVATLNRLGLPAKLDFGNEITVDGKRIADVSGGQIGDAFVITCHLFFDFAYQLMTQVWRVPWPPVRRLASAALREHITTIWQRSGPITIESFQWMLLEEFGKILERPVVRGTPKQAETRLSREIAEKLHASEYLNLQGLTIKDKSTFSLQITASVAVHATEFNQNGRPIHATFLVQNQIIEQALLESNPPSDW